MGFTLTPENKKINHVDPKKWNKLIKDKKTLVLDSRKPFEYKVGTFKNQLIQMLIILENFQNI